MADVFTGMHDILLGYDTDIYFENGDLMLTTGIDYIIREIYKLMITSPGDWRLAPSLGCSLEKFVGENNTRELAEKIQEHLQKGLSMTVYPSQAVIKVVPTDYDRILCFIDLYLLNDNFVTIPFEFDYTSGSIKINRMDEKTTKPQSTKNLQVNNIRNMRKPNKYWEQFRSQ